MTDGRPELTKKERVIFDFIKNWILSKGYSPSLREISEGIGHKSTSSLYLYLDALEEKGYIRRNTERARSIEVCDDIFQSMREDIVTIPLLGQVAAGLPTFAQQNIESSIPVPSSILPQGDSFILRVHGNSMINAGILNNDLIFVHACNTAENGDIIVALIGDSATVKRFYKEDKYVRLQPENDNLEPIIVNDCRILGKVFGVFRLMQ